jgi:hypothetical protein
MAEWLFEVLKQHPLAHADAGTRHPAPLARSHALHPALEAGH